MIQTKRLEIREIAAEDWRRLMEIWADVAQSPYAQYDVPHEDPPEVVREKVAQWAAVTPGGVHMFFAVCHQGQMIGCIDLHRDGDGCECGYCFHSAWHGNGYARESLEALLAWLPRLGAKRVTAGTALDNLPSVRLLRALGFRQVGTEQVSYYRDSQGNDIWFDGGIFERELL